MPPRKATQQIADSVGDPYLNIAQVTSPRRLRVGSTVQGVAGDNDRVKKTSASSDKGTPRRTSARLIYLAKEKALKEKATTVKKRKRGDGTPECTTKHHRSGIDEDLRLTESRKSKRQKTAQGGSNKEGPSTVTRLKGKARSPRKTLALPKSSSPLPSYTKRKREDDEEEGNLDESEEKQDQLDGPSSSKRARKEVIPAPRVGVRFTTPVRREPAAKPSGTSASPTNTGQFSPPMHSDSLGRSPKPLSRKDTRIYDGWAYHHKKLPSRLPGLPSIYGAPDTARSPGPVLALGTLPAVLRQSSEDDL